MKYHCYVDESNHDRNIKYIKEKGKFNFELQKNNNEFIVVNTLIKDESIHNVYKMLLQFREKYNYDENTELKGQNFFQGTKNNKKFCYGFSDYTDDNINRLTDFLNIIEENGISNNIAFKNKKSNFHVALVFHMMKSNYGLHAYEFTNILAMLDLILDQIDSANIYELIGVNKLYSAHRQLLKKMKEFRKTQFAVTSIDEKSRIESHKKAMKDLAQFFPKSSHQNLSNFSEKWSYENGVDGLLNDLRFRNIDINDINIIVDDEYNMNLVYCDNFQNVQPCKSGDIKNVNSMLLAIPDLIAYSFHLLNENFMNNKINKEFNEKQLLDPKFFDLNKEQYELVKRFRKNLLKDGEDDFYATYIFITSRSFQYVIAYIIEISTYGTYAEFIDAKEELPERTNTRLLGIRQSLYYSSDSFEREQAWRNAI